MDKNIKLKKPPIKEAQISLRFSNPIKLEQINLYVSKLSNFKSKDNFYTFTQTISFGNVTPNPENVTQKQIGYRLFSEDKKMGLVFTFDSLAFSVVNSYEGWEKFKAQFFTIIKELGVAGFDASIALVGLRFINSMDFNAGEDLSKYLKILPDIPEREFSSVADNLILRYNVTEQRGAKASVGFIYEGIQPKTQKLLFSFDIMTNLTKSVAVPVDNIKVDLEYLRLYKNDIFFNSIKPDLIERYNA